MVFPPFAYHKSMCPAAGRAPVSGGGTLTAGAIDELGRAVLISGGMTGIDRTTTGGAHDTLLPRDESAYL